ncbi:Asp-tRNA(Asn)/Glu-tRNA(Gln) amidotransferase subunit GatA [bacterium]|nr:Asp-tRNA(Asn)/Glu-tRNA(Gln) amidotransferase subunit GatA [bacterium]
MKLCDYNAFELSQMLQQKKVTAMEVTQSVLERIELRESELNAFIHVTAGTALAQAKEADARIQSGKATPMTGLPVAIKDNICTNGIQTTAGSKILENYIPPYNATCVDKLRNDGAIIIGKTNMDQFGMGSSTEKSAFGVTKNPVNPEYVPGGSSGGSAAATAAGETILALGTDTGGSIRMPAAYCGCTGIKPTYGRVSRYGVIAYASSLDQVGGFGRTVADLALLLNSICGHDALDSTSANISKPDFTRALNKDVAGLKIGLPREYFAEGMDPAVKENILKAVKTYEDMGAEIMEVSFPNIKYAIATYYLLATAEASSNLARYDGVRFGYRAEKNADDLLSMYETTRSEGFGDEVKRRIMLGSYVLSAGYYDAYYRKAQKARTLIRQDFDHAFELVDCILAPVTPSTPFKLGEKNDDPLQMYLEDIYTVSLNLAGLPGMTVNCGQVRDLPVGFQLIGKAFDESMVLRVGHAYEMHLK